MSQIRRWLSKYAIDFLLVLMIDHCARLKVYLLSGAIFFPVMQLNVNTYANSIIESSFTLMKFMEVLMNVYLRYSFNCWRKWFYILLNWTAKGVYRWDRQKLNHATNTNELLKRLTSTTSPNTTLRASHIIDWDSATCSTYSTDYYQRITLKSWFTSLEQTSLNRCTGNRDTFIIHFTTHLFA